MLMSTRMTQALEQERRRRLQAPIGRSGKTEKATRDRGLAVPAAAWRAEPAAGR